MQSRNTFLLSALAVERWDEPVAIHREFRETSQWGFSVAVPMRVGPGYLVSLVTWVLMAEMESIIKMGNFLLKVTILWARDLFHACLLLVRYFHSRYHYS